MRNFIVIFVMMAFAFSVKAQQANDTVSAAICEGTVYEFYGTGSTLLTTVDVDHPLTDSVILYGATGFEDTLTLTLNFYPMYSNTDAVTIYKSDLPYTYGDNATCGDITFDTGTVSGVYSVMLRTVNGCDSLITLSLTVNPALDESVLTWLTSETVSTNWGSGNGATTLTPFMEFYKEDLTPYKVVGINKVQFMLSTNSTYFSAVSGCKVVIMQGNDINSATVKHIQTVASPVSGWNTITLDSVYLVDANQRLYVGYEVTTSRAAFPIPSAAGTETKQAWMKWNDGSISNVITDEGYQLSFYIKANALVEDPNNKMTFSSLSMGNGYRIVGESVSVSGVVKNSGKNAITSFKVQYTADGVASTTETVSVNIPPEGTYTFTHPAAYTLSTAKVYNFTVTVSEPNGVAGGVIGVNTRNVTINAYSEVVQRVVLHEVFTASTCPPCKQGNETLDGVLKSVNASNWACVKYQYKYPGTGDPYYTAEVGDKEVFYAGSLGAIYSTVGVPYLLCDGGLLTLNPQSYTTSIFDALASIPAAAKTTSNATIDIDNKKVDFHVKIDPVITVNSSNLRLFVAIVEKITTENVKNNGETEFHNVLKKFMPNANGNAISSFAVNTPIEQDFSYTFNGNYRLPSNANSPINHSTEHSVEDFKALMVVYWIQDIVTKEVYQAGDANPYPGYKDPLSVTDIALNPFNVVLYPNPVQNNLYIDMDGDISRLEIFSIQGQCLKTETTNSKVISTDNLASGLYMLRITTDKGVSIHKFVKQ